MFYFGRCSGSSPAFSGDVEMLDAALDVLSFALNLNHRACQESALHGLGHLAYDDRQKTTSVIEAWLRGRQSDPLLRTYARNATIESVR